MQLGYVFGLAGIEHQCATQSCFACHRLGSSEAWGWESLLLLPALMQSELEVRCHVYVTRIMCCRSFLRSGMPKPSQSQAAAAPHMPHNPGRGRVFWAATVAMFQAKVWLLRVSTSSCAPMHSTTNNAVFLNFSRNF